MVALRQRLLAWYAGARRPLPWRTRARASDPYAVWVSEVMLQQTRVATAIPYYERWMRHFPDATAVAAARLEEVLALWSGLGYYRRARQLHAAARLVVQRHGGRLPMEPAALLALPGVGRYSAAAILSIAGGRPLAAVDGNVRRIVARVFAAAGPNPVSKLPAIEELAHAWLDRKRPGEFNQALMDLGATICLPRRPLCPACPLRRGCASADRPLAAPPGRRAVRVREAYGLYCRGGRVWLRRRPERAARLPGLWELPALPAVAGSAGQRLGSVRHTITVHAITAEVYAMTLPAPRPGRWVSEGEAATMPLTGLARKIVRRFAGWKL